ncbi:MAG: glycosyl transferase family 2 [Frankiales bacterium]|nr:glycosyl transferase family 2 [Frankiales bacterium]
MTVKIDVVVVAYGEEPYLSDCVDSLLASVDVDLQVAVVDNGCTRADLTSIVSRGEIVLVSPGVNLGFSEGCNEGARRLTGDVIVLVNSDAVVAPDALSELAAALSPAVGLTTACVLQADHPELVNSAGNPMHFLGASWSGGHGQPRSQHEVARDVVSASGAASAITRALWEELGGFEPSLFMYCEDADLSLRVWQQAKRVRYVPTAQVWHHYAFERNPRKLYFLERNRLVVVLTVFQRRTLLVLLPALVAAEVGLIVSAAAEGRLPDKLRSYGWILRHRRYLRRRRARVQSARIVSDRVFAPLLSGRLDSELAAGRAVGLANAVLPAYWRLARRCL